MCDHALGVRKIGEEQGWGLLLPSLKIELDGSEFTNLRDEARATNASTGHPRLGPIYNEFLDMIHRSVQRADRLDWFWEERPGSDCRWLTFSPEGIIAHLDEDYVRNGYLAENDSSCWSGGAGIPCFRLFLACLARLQAKYNRAVKSGRIQNIQPALETVLRSGLAEAAWSALS